MTEARVSEAQRVYGKRFLAQWHPTDLRTRAEAHGYVHEYDFYRKSSAVLHGASAGKTGLVADSEGSIHFRTGPALELCQIAYPHLVTFFRAFVDAYGPLMPKTSVDPLIEVLDHYREMTPQYVDLVTELDKAAWPKGPVVGPCAVAVITASKGLRWYLHDIPNARIREARLTHNLDGGLAEALREAEEVASSSGTDDPLSIAVVGVVVEPLDSAEWLGEQEILLPQGRHQTSSTQPAKIRD